MQGIFTEFRNTFLQKTLLNGHFGGDHKKPDVKTRNFSFSVFYTRCV